MIIHHHYDLILPYRLPNCKTISATKHRRRKRPYGHLFSRTWKSKLYHILLDKRSQPSVHSKWSHSTVTKHTRTHSGIYRCTAENLYGNGEKGIHSQSMVLNVLCKCILFPFSCTYTCYFIVTRKLCTNVITNVLSLV